MKNKTTPRKINRRNFLKMGAGGAGGALVAAVGGGALSALTKSSPTLAAPAPPELQPVLPAQRPNALFTKKRLVTTDGFMSLPGRRIAVASEPKDNGIYVFGYSDAVVTDSIGQVTKDHKGKVTTPSPILHVNENVDFYWTITNVGFEMRPDLDDAHTVHWHGFRNPTAIFDGVPELSISVPPARDFTYFFKPQDAGTYLYHCHFEDVEHVQMGMDGVIFIRPSATSPVNPRWNAYDTGFGPATTFFDREYTLLFNEVDTRPHDNLLAVQEFVWSDFKPNYWNINGRAYPDTLRTDQELFDAFAVDDDPLKVGDGSEAADLKYRQPISSLIQALPNERILLRMGHLGYQQQSIQLLGIPMEVVGHDATWLEDQTYTTNTIYIGPGENRDVIFTAPNYEASLPGGSDAAGDYNVYWLRNRNYQHLVNGDDTSGPGGMMTQVRVYKLNVGDHHADFDDPQDHPNQTIPKV